jgi:hypothetical protein
MKIAQKYNICSNTTFDYLILVNYFVTVPNFLYKVILDLYLNKNQVCVLKE